MSHWALLEGDAASLTVHATSGRITWNAACQAMLEHPRRVQLRYNSGDARLGLLPIGGGSGAHVLPVVHGDDGTFKIEAKAQLQSEGLVPDSNYTVTPNYPDPAPTPPATNDTEGCVWWEVP